MRHSLHKTAYCSAPSLQVAGKANVCIFPDLNTGNNTYKAVQQSTGAIAIGPLMQVSSGAGQGSVRWACWACWGCWACCGGRSAVQPAAGWLGSWGFVEIEAAERDLPCTR